LKSEQKQVVKNPDSLKVLVIEDSFESRVLIKSHLSRVGIKYIKTLENGSSLLTDNKVLDADILLVGFGLGYCHSGIELVNALDAAALLPVLCKVVFITNSELTASSNHPFRYLKCEVLLKPIKPENLWQIIQQGYSSIVFFKDALNELMNNKFGTLSIRLERMPIGQLSATQLDELAVINTHLLLRLGQGNKAWKINHAIKDEVFRATNRLSIANALGDERKLKLTMGMLKGIPTMYKRGLIYQIYRAINEHDYQVAQAYFNDQPKHKFSLAEIELNALLLIEAESIESAQKFLTFKLGTSLDNLFFRHSIKLIMIKCHLYVLLENLQTVEHMQKQLKVIKNLLEKTQWQRGSVDFSSIMSYVNCTVSLLKNRSDSEQRHNYLNIRQELVCHGFFCNLLMSINAHSLKELEQSKEYLLRANNNMLSLEVSVEALVRKVWFKRVINALFVGSERAKEYNRIGINHTREKNPYQALNMFYLSHLCAPKQASIAINLLDAITKLGLHQYWHVRSIELVEKIYSLSLRDNEQRKFAQVLAKLEALSSSCDV
jgi:DNA-binding NarL/FixJ family response regulator